MPSSLLFHCLLGVLMIGAGAAAQEAGTTRPRAREAGVVIGTLPTGNLNAITDVSGVLVGHVTLHDGKHLHTGVTAIRPHVGNLFEERVPAAIHVGNGFGKSLGVTQVAELGELETPIVLTGTLSVWRAADALTTWMIEQPGMDSVRSLNPVVGETNDGQLSDIRARPIEPKHVLEALNNAKSGTVEEGAVGAGSGTVCFDFKGGIGTSSRVVGTGGSNYTVGVLVQSNYGGQLTIAGVPVWKSLEKAGKASGDGSIMMIVATDAPLDARLLNRLARRALVGLARTGSVMSNGSGDYVIAFSTAEACRRKRGDAIHRVAELSNEAMTPLFQAAAEATEEAIVNSLFRSTTVEGHRRTARALPLETVLESLKAAGVLVKK